ncbi:MAG: ABC transporter ATP-binding protein [Sorangiineae bacterium]|nr:ABC transporter ATP-binding protein [Polyangiaceae bacterium]MEB2324638.1 ABC transporter ATP-binding protein [Sorangiineae bacterium]
MSEPLIRVEGLEKTFRQGLLMRRVEAVRGISFEVNEGEVCGFLGPNGAGKTTAIKMLTGLIQPTAGRATIFGEPIPSPRAMARLGFMPENPYVYPYLTPTEFVELCGRLSGQKGKALRERTRTVLERVGMLYAADRPVRRLSKGMLQRTGLAAALVAEPELLVLDEPMSGLDPVGRKEVREIILEERKQGRTIFFSTHILSDVESMCDRVIILRRGQVVVSGKLDELLRRDVQRVDVVLAGATDELVRERGLSATRVSDRVIVHLDGRAKLRELLEAALARGIEVVEVTSHQETLEELFVREAIGGGS